MTQRTAKKSTARSEDVVIDAAGLPVDCAGHVWKLNSAAGYKAIDWRSFPVSSDSIKAATVQFIRHMIETQSASSVRNSLDTITLVFRSASFVDADRSNETIPFAMFTELRSSLGHAAWRLHHIRQWYGWCANYGFANFSPDVAFQADQMSIGGNRKGHAVLSADPEQVPLTDGELAALLTALKAARGTTKLSLDQQAARPLALRGPGAQPHADGHAGGGRSHPAQGRRPDRLCPSAGPQNEEARERGAIKFPNARIDERDRGSPSRVDRPQLVSRTGRWRCRAAEPADLSASNTSRGPCGRSS
ncbi:hypothetical protein [Devosia sp.]|uniref:hypothetical protein n=1 Tax=Devosia sp. TaxID=1871048 RepID=UPI0037BE8B27